MDKEYVILHAIEQDQNVTQRELSFKAQISLGSVNLLINKMVKEGLIKIGQIPMNRVVYMLTPKGMTEKINKTSKYIKHHYSHINEMKEKMRVQLLKLSDAYDKVYIVLEGDEISEVVKLAAHDIKGINYIDRKGYEHDNLKEELSERKVVVVLQLETYAEVQEIQDVVQLLERL